MQATKNELMESAKLLCEAKKRAERKAMLAQEPVLRRAWERQALALRHGAEALKEAAER